MIQGITGRGGTLSNSANSYNVVQGGDTWNTNVAVLKQLACVGTYSYFYVELGAAPGAGTSYDFTVVKNGVDTAITVHIADAAVGGTYSGAGVAFAEGDIIYLKSVPTNTPTVTNCSWVLKFDGTTANESNLMFGGVCDNSATQYQGVTGGGVGVTSTTEVQVSQIIPTAGTINRLFTSLSADPGTSPDAYSFTLYLNGVATTLTCTITADDTTGSDTTHNVAVVAGDLVSLEIVPLNTPSARPRIYGKLSFVATINGESLLLGGTNVNTSTSATRYHYCNRTILFSPISTEANSYQRGYTSVFKKLYAALSGTPGAGKSYAITLRINAGNGTLTCTIADAATTANDTIHTDNITSNDAIDIDVTPSGTPTARYVKTGLVSYIAVSTPSSSISSSPSASASHSPSRSISTSISASPSPSSSVSSSVSGSISKSPSLSLSSSLSSSVSISLSSSPSGSPSSSLSLSPSTSISSSTSPSTENYSRGDYLALPAADDDLSTSYSAIDYIYVAAVDNDWVDQSASGKYAIHQFKNFVGTFNSGIFTCVLQTNSPPPLVTVYLQIYNRSTLTWDTIDSDNTSPEDTDFTLTATISDLTNYKDGADTVACRVYQQG